MRPVIFDLDGTLVDSAPDIAASVNRVLAANGLAPLKLAEVMTMIGDGAKPLLARAFAARGVAHDPAHLAAFIADYQANPVTETAPYPGMVALLDELARRKVLMAVCTNKPHAPAVRILEALGLGRFFAAVLGGDSLPYKKPDPRHLAATLAALEVTDAIMVGDHHNDLAAAAALGLPGVHVRWGYGEASSPHSAADAAQLLQILERMG
ncbi:phosphoglycolate phosphatase [Acidocella sp.]|uniref:phosphoglycolate phosphatase n=1 Tax=Acidocella sp. TaxID=50710 RepID=UPI00263352D7|nr:phosphoglycolate phosphatase [Acidocella sp.]